MDFNYGEGSEAFRSYVRHVLSAELPRKWSGIGVLSESERDDFIIWWRDRLRERGLIAVHWPKKYGGQGLGVAERIILSEELSKVGVPDGTTNDVHGISMLGNTMLQLGTDEQKAYFLPRIISREDIWCQGFSEPDAGSDLANIRTRGVLDGSEWVVTGQKIWTSAGQRANYIFLLCRTEESYDRHRGLSFLLCPLDQSGIEVRPIRMLSGESEFNEVFFTEARVPVENILGDRGSGWAVAMTLLGFERGENLLAITARFDREFQRLRDLVTSEGLGGDTRVRDRMAYLYTRLQILRWLGYRNISRMLLGLEIGQEASMAKVLWSEYHALVTEFAVDVLGSRALVISGRGPHPAFQIDDPGTPGSSASWLGEFLNARGDLIAAGTSEIQRNILGERVLGLPR